MGLKINGIPVAGLGLPGKQGEIGPKGEPGEPGKSAYQAALDGGYQGTEQEFNEFLATMKSSVNADWSQNDETAGDYIKNRTHWVENPTAEIFVNNNIENTGSEVYRYEFIHPFKYDDIGKTYTVVYGDDEYQLQLADMSGDGFQLYNEDPYLSLQFYPELLEIWVEPENPVVDKYEVAVYDGSAAGEIVHPLDPKFVTSISETNKGLEQKFWRGTKEEFDAVETKDENTMYIITDEDSESGSGSGLPEFTEEDEGKILRIVGGEVAWATIANAEEASF